MKFINKLREMMRPDYTVAGRELGALLRGFKDGRCRLVYVERKYTINPSAFSYQTFRTPTKLREMRGQRHD